ncbi:hypothetical protein GQ457_14G014040 [Hibiscus cannabinus]
MADSASFDQSFTYDLTSLDTNEQITMIFPRQVLASFDHNFIHDLVTLDTNDQITVADPASLDRSHYISSASLNRSYI